MLRSLPPVGHPVPLRTILSAFIKQRNRGDFLKDWNAQGQFTLVSSGSAALLLALKSLKLISNKQQVVLPAYTCPSVLASVVKAGLKPVLCDMKADSFQMDPEQVTSKIGADTLAVIAVHLFGIPEDIKCLRKLTRQKEIFLIEDAAQAFGNKVDGKDLGLFGDISILSFGRGKPLSMLCGGAVITNDLDLYSYVNKVHQSIRDKSRWIFKPQYLIMLILYSIFFHPRFYWFPLRLPWLKIGETVFTLDFDLNKINPKVMSLGILLYQEFREIRQVRLGLTERYKEKLIQFEEDFMYFPDIKGADIALLRFPIIFKEKDKRDKVLSSLEEKGLGATGSYPAPLNELEGVSAYLKSTESYPNAKAISERVLTLPLHQYVTYRDIEDIITLIELKLN